MTLDRRWQCCVKVCGMVLLTLWCTLTSAHESLPAALLLQEVDAGVFEVRWRVPHSQGAAAVVPQLPQDCQSRNAPTLQADAGARLLVWSVGCTHGLRGGAQIVFTGLAAVQIDALVRVAFQDGSVESHVARPRSPSVTLALPRSNPAAAEAYLALGVEHILGGIDHLLFVLCLILLVPNLWSLLKTITAFTLAHSFTLALAALEVVKVPQAPVEATIALSILFLARALARRGANQGIASQRPWAVALVFGLLHGFGFASALATIGLPQSDIPMALLLFNGGVELGQLGFIAAVYPLVLLTRRWQHRITLWVAAMPVYAIGSVAGFWWLQRMAIMIGIV